MHDFAIAKALGHMGQFSHQLAAGRTAADIHIDAAHHLAAGLVFGAQLTQAHDARLGTGAAGFHALANPHLFLRQQLVGTGVDDRFLRQLFFLLHQVGREIAGVRQQLAAVQFHDACGHIVQKRTVVGDGDDAAFEINQQAFEPFNAVQIQVVGRLVQQQHVGLRHQCLRQGHTFFGAARQRVDNGLGVQMQALQRLAHALLPVPAIQRLNLALHRVQVAMTQAIFFDQANHPRQADARRLEYGRLSVELWFLGDVGNPGATLHLQGAVIGLLHAAQNFEHGGFASAVAADQAHALRGFEGKSSVVEQGYVPKSQLGVK